MNRVIRNVLALAILSTLFVGQAYALNCSLSVNNGRAADGALISTLPATLGPTASRLYSTVRECTPRGKTLCLRATNVFNRPSSGSCTVALYACPAIVRKYQVPCKKGPVFIDEKGVIPGGQRSVFKGVVNPIKLDRRKRKTQVSFQTVSICTENNTDITIKSNVVGVNVTCKNGITMDKFMSELPRRLK